MTLDEWCELTNSRLIASSDSDVILVLTTRPRTCPYCGRLWGDGDICQYCGLACKYDPSGLSDYEIFSGSGGVYCLTPRIEETDDDARNLCVVQASDGEPRYVDHVLVMPGLDEGSGGSGA